MAILFLHIYILMFPLHKLPKSKRLSIKKAELRNTTRPIPVPIALKIIRNYHQRIISMKDHKHQVPFKILDGCYKQTEALVF